MTPTTPEVPQREDEATQAECEQYGNSECPTCRSLLWDHPRTGNPLVMRQLVNTRCGHHSHCVEIVKCAGCGTLNAFCHHCRPTTCSFCERAKAIHDAEHAEREAIVGGRL